MPSLPRSFLRVIAPLVSPTVLALVLVSSRAGAQEAWSNPAGDEPALAMPPPPVDVSDDARHDTVVLVHIDAPEAVALQRQDARGKWAPVCTSPCDRPLAEHRSYRVAGAGVRPSAMFSLSGHGDRVVLAVNPSASGWVAAGAVAAGVGGASIATGAFITLVIAPLEGLANAFGPRAAPGSSGSAESSASSAGVVTMVGGGVLLVAGLVTLLADPSTDVTLRDGATVSRVSLPPSPQPPQPPPPEVHLPRAATLSLFTARF
ncbi:MAG TPA: hypothetical protein VGG39_03060 [Polyangiaceae bacterium]|jgi:hypothetical protein